MKNKMKINFIKQYKADIINLVSQLKNDKIIDLKNKIINTKRKKRKVYIFGNGGSAAMASHVAVDFSKNAKTNMMNMMKYKKYYLAIFLFLV